MEIELQNDNCIIDHTLNKDFVKVLSENTDHITPFMDLFWQQQKKLFQSSPKGMLIDTPMIIR